MKLILTTKANQAGSALLLVLIMSAIALAVLASVMAWSSNNATLTYRTIQYHQSIEASEAATEKVVGQMLSDFTYGGESLVVNNLNSYRQNLTPSVSDSAYWNGWLFDDGNENLGQTYVQRLPGTNYTALGTYAGLMGSVSTYIVASHAQNTLNSQQLEGGVIQTLQLATIPIFQFAMYSSGDMEISCGQPLDVTGRVHSNGTLYVEPDNSLTFESSVTAVVNILFQREPADPRGAPVGSVVYVHPEEKLSPVAPLSLPIGTSNSPTAVREIIEPSPSGEDQNSALGRLRYNNICDLVLTVADSGVTAVSGYFNPHQFAVTNQLALFVSTGSSFWDGREKKTVQPVDINIGNLTSWIATNGYTANLSSIYVLDTRNLAGNNLNAVRVYNGTNLPPNGLTIATARPLYVWGDYNELNPANLGTSDTSATRPASLAADAITFLSDNWNDSQNTTANGHSASSTTYNVALLTGVVETTTTAYSGGMENFPRFLEVWGKSNTNTYNGSMIKMFPSLYATNNWGSGYYLPPARNWAYDVNFDDPTKLPPKTPGLQTVSRSQWATLPPGTNVPNTFY